MRTPTTILLLTAVAMISFAANSILARLALRQGEIDAGTFTAVRIVSAAVGLALVVSVSGERHFREFFPTDFPNKSPASALMTVCQASACDCATMTRTS